MVYICNICEKTFNSKTFDDLKEYCSHVGKCPVRSDNFFVERFRCGICTNVVRTAKGFREHLLKCSQPLKNSSSSSSHSQMSLKTETINKRITAFNENRKMSPVFVKPTGNQDENEDVDYSQDISAVSVNSKPKTRESSSRLEYCDKLLEVAAKMFGRHNISMDGAESAMKDLGSVLDIVSEYVQSEIMEIVHFTLPPNQDFVRQRAKDISEKIKHSLDSINTEQKVMTILKRKELLELPVRKVYNEKDVQINDSFKTLKSEAVVFPIEHQIRSLLQKPHVIEAMMDYQAKLESPSCDEINHYLNSDHWKQVKQNYVGKQVIPLFLYNDDFAPDDSLSPHAGSNKISAFYCSFPSLPPQYRSLLDNIQVLMLAKSEEMKEVGVNKVINILAQALKPLERNGIQINGKLFHIAPVLLMGDNLGLNLNLGFMSPTATFFCRFCYMSMQEAKHCCKEKEELIRTQEHFNQCRATINAPDKNFGIRDKCDLELLGSFKVSKNYVVDIMHDLLSGVFIYDIKELIKKGVSNKLFTLQQFNDAKNSVYYGSKENQYRMENITCPEKDKYSVRCHAREMLSLIKFLPFILKKILPPQNKLLKFGLKMVDLLDFALKCSFTTVDLQKFEEVITQHNRNFVQLFERNLTPKFHNLLHYIRVIKNCGPLKDLWSMRFEAKHQEIKAQAKVMHSRRHICLSFAKKICFHNAYKALINNDGLPRSIRNFTKKNEPFVANFKNELESYVNCSKVNFNGLIYTEHNFIISSCRNYAFKITQIGLNERLDNVKLVTEKHSIKYMESLRSYKLCESTKILECRNLMNFSKPPLDSHIFEGAYFFRDEELCIS